MKLSFIGIASLALTLMAGELYTPPADACGVKLALKVQRPRKAAGKSMRPSRLLLVGSPPKRLEHDLQSAGHNVEVVGSTGDAKGSSYEVVVVANNDQATEARTRFPDATVVVRSGDITADVRSIEGQVGRRPIRADESRAVVAAGPSRSPVAAQGGDDTRKPVAAKEPTETKVAAKEPGTAEPVPVTPTKVEAKPEQKQAAAGKAEPKQVAKAEKPEKTTPAVAKAEKAEKPKAEKTAPKRVATAGKTDEPARAPSKASLDQELYFSTNSSAVDNKKSLEFVATWLKGHNDVKVVVAGYADPRGRADANLSLSQHRAESVRDALVAAGIEESRLKVEFYGDTKLKYGKTDPRNRRVSIESQSAASAGN